MKTAKALLSVPSLAILPLLLCFHTAIAETIIAPTNAAFMDEAFGSGVLASEQRLQEVYGAANFPPGGLHITEIRFRPDYFYGKPFSNEVVHLEIRLSTTEAPPDGLSGDFSQNIGADETLVFSGSITLSSQFTGPAGGPKDFDIAIPFTTPFTYGPADGNLLVDIRNFTGSSASALSGFSSDGDQASRLYAASANASDGSVDSGADALQLVYTPTAAPPPRLTRGPYLQLGTTSNMVVRWRSKRVVDSRVRFGLAENVLEWEITDPAPVTEHILTLTNLTPDTKYFYEVSTTTANLVNATNGWFYTAPAGPKPVRIWALGDSGTANQPNYSGQQARVRDAYHAFTGSRYTDVWLMLGDNAYQNGTDQQYQDTLFNIYPVSLRTTPLWPTIGNHDVTVGGGNYAYLNIFSFPTQGEAGGVASGSKHYYSFNYANIHFVCLDSEESGYAPDGAMLTWLDQDLAANTNDWTIAYWHRPPYSFSTHNSDYEGPMILLRENAVPILESHGVDLVLCGHSHSYERSYLIDGHYGKSTTFTPLMVKDSGSGRTNETGAYRKSSTGPAPHEGAVYVVCGSSGWVTWDTTIPQYLHPAMFIKWKQLGSMVIDVNSNRLDAAFLRETGAVDDYFTILKGAAPEPTRLATFRIQSGTIRAQFKTEAGHTYRLQRTPTLEAPDWRDVSADLLATGATTGWTNAVPPGEPRSFYRAVKLD